MPSQQHTDILGVTVLNSPIRQIIQLGSYCQSQDPVQTVSAELMSFTQVCRTYGCRSADLDYKTNH